MEKGIFRKDLERCKKFKKKGIKDVNLHECSQDDIICCALRG